MGTVKPAASFIKRMLRPNVSLLLTGQLAGRDSPLFPSRNGDICFFTCSHRFALTWSQEGKMCERAGHNQRLGNSARDCDTRAGSTPRSTSLASPLLHHRSTHAKPPALQVGTWGGNILETATPQWREGVMRSLTFLRDQTNPGGGAWRNPLRRRRA